MRELAHVVGRSIRERLAGWLMITFGFLVLYYLALLASLMVRFGRVPNYVTAYDWPASVATIIRSTPSFSDTVPIIMEEWLLEVGYMNMDYGLGLSEWSLNLIPAKMVVILLLGAMIATVWALLRHQSVACRRQQTLSAMATAGTGSFLVALTGATLSWVVCCATPSWIVGLAMLGLGVATANWIEPIGVWINLGGFAILAATILGLARQMAGEGRAAPASGRPRGVGATAAR